MFICSCLFVIFYLFSRFLKERFPYSWVDIDMSRYMSKMYLQYCKDNKLEDVRVCLSEGVDVNTVSDNGRWSALTIAAHKNLPDLLELVLSQPGIQVNKTTDAKAAGWSSCQWSPLTFACHAGNSAIVARLVETEGVNINFQGHISSINIM